MRAIHICLNTAAILSGAILFLISNECSAKTFFLDDTCYATFEKIYHGAKEDMGRCIIQTADSNYIIAGTTSSNGAGGLDVLIQKFNRYGDAIWSSVIGGAGNDYVYGIIQSGDHGYVAAGTTQSFGGGIAGVAWMLKVDSDGNLLWSKKYDDGTYNGSIFYDLAQTIDGGFVMVGSSDYAPSDAQFLVIKTDSAGEVTWTKKFDSGSTDFATGIYADQDSLFVAGDARGGNTFYDGVVIKMKRSSGFVGWTRKYDIEEGNNWFGQIKRSGADFIIRTETTDDWADNDPRSIIVRIKNDGTPVNLIKIQPSFSNDFGAMILTYDGGIVMNEINWNDDNADSHIYKFDINGDLTWSRGVSGYGKQRLWSGIQTFDHSYVFTGDDNATPAISDSDNLLIVKLDSAGDIPECLTLPATITLETPDYNYQDFYNWSSVSSPDITASDADAEQTIFEFDEQVVCYHCHEDVGTLVNNTVIAENSLICYPNPLITQSSIQFNLSGASTIALELFDLEGRKIETLEHGSYEAGSHHLFLAKGDLPSGIYFLKLRTQSVVITNNLVIQ